MLIAPLTHHPDITRRTAQRWLKQLVDERNISTQGDGRGRIYLPVATTHEFSR